MCDDMTAADNDWIDGETATVESLVVRDAGGAPTYCAALRRS